MAVPNAASIAAVAGLHPRVAVAPVTVIVGGTISDVQVTVEDAVDELLHASVAVHILVCEREHPDEVTVPSVDVNVGVPQLSLAVATPKAASIAAVVGLHPRVAVAPVIVIAGGVRSDVQVTAEDAVAVFPHASVAIHVLV